MNKNSKKLLQYYRSLPDEVAAQLLEYAEFLSQRYQPRVNEIPEPQHVPGPENETVVAAVKRLSEIYSMVDKDNLLDETASLVSQNMLQGRDSREVINELEAVFKKHYDMFVAEFKQESTE